MYMCMSYLSVFIKISKFQYYIPGHYREWELKLYSVCDCCNMQLQAFNQRLGLEERERGREGGGGREREGEGGRGRVREGERIM